MGWNWTRKPQNLWIAAITILLYGAGGALSLFDSSSHSHRVCSEHGELIHESGDSGPHEILGVEETTGSISSTPVRTDSSHPLHCAFSPVSRMVSEGDLSLLADFQFIPEAAKPPALDARGSFLKTAVYLIAPKTSPPCA